MLDYLEYLKNPSILANSYITSKILVQLIRKMYLNEGIDYESDDIHRPIYREKLSKIAAIINSRTEISEAIKKCIN